MDAKTEPIIAVIGFPVGGNPSQFAIERALKSVGLDWRVFSFELLPEDISTALDGLEVLGVSGVLIGITLTEATLDWRCESEADRLPFTDCLYRNDTDGPFVKYDSQHSWIKSRIQNHASSLQRDIETTFVFGEVPTSAVWRTELIEGTIEKPPRKLEKLSEADLIVIEQGTTEPVPLNLENWPRGTESTLVIDVSEGHPNLSQIKSLGYKVISRHMRRIGMLSECFHRWTKLDAPKDVILDAIEEYLAV